MSEDEQQSLSESTATSLRRRAFQHRRAVIGGSRRRYYVHLLYGTKPIFLKKINETVRTGCSFYPALTPKHSSALPPQSVAGCLAIPTYNISAYRCLSVWRANSVCTICRHSAAS
jgi:hypothetical protein